MKTTKKIIGGIVASTAVIGGSFVAMASAASAATPVTAVTHLTQRPDSGYSGNDWALDNLTRTATITGGATVADSLCGTPMPASCFTYNISISDTGVAYATTGAISPGAQAIAIKGTPQAAVSGTMSGTFYASSASPDATLVPGALAGASVSSGDWAKQFFPAGTQFDVTHSTDNFSYTYTDLKDCQKWVDALNGTQTTSGDITGADSCTTSVAAVGNQVVTVGQAASIPVFGSTTSSDKALTYTTTGLPGGLSLNASTGVISGKPTATATGGTVTVTVSDFAGVQASTSFGITVNPAATTPAPVVLSHGRVVTVSNNRAEVAWNATPLAAEYKVTLVGPNFPGGRTNTIKVTSAFYTGLAAGHTYSVTVTPENANGVADGASGHVTVVTTSS